MRLAFTVVAVAVLLAGCGGDTQESSTNVYQPPTEGSETATAPPTEATTTIMPPATSKTYKIAVIPKGLVHQFWKTVKAGAEAAGRDLGAEILWDGPAQETEAFEQINIVEDKISAGVDAIVMAAVHEVGLVDVIKKATDKGIPVVMIDSGVKSDLPVSFVATDNTHAAELAADELARLIGGKGVVGSIPFVPGAGTSELRESGFDQGMKKYPDIRVVEPRYSHSDAARGMAAAQDMLTAERELSGIFAANEASAIGAIQAIRAAGKSGIVKLVAFDAAEEEIAALKEGVIQALIVQDPFRMGYEGVQAAIQHLKGEEVPSRIDTGVTVVTMENFEANIVQQLLYPLKDQ